MRTLLCTLLLLAGLATSAHAQKVAIKKGVILLDRQPYAHIEDAGDYTYYISNLQNERLFVVKHVYFTDPQPAYPTGAASETHYWQFVFTKSKTVVEMPFFATYGQDNLVVARKICLARLLKNDALDPQALADFVTNNGAPYSERREALNRAPTLLPASQ